MKSLLVFLTLFSTLSSNEIDILSCLKNLQGLFSQENNEPSFIETKHTYECNGLSFDYTAIAGTLPLINEKGAELAEIFFITYLMDEQEPLPEEPGFGIPDETERPITFIFPGGPGGSSAEEILCTIGPHRLLTPAEGKRLLPPYKIIDNPETLLPWTDLIFVDPVTVGYSKLNEALDDQDKKIFFSVDGDIASLGEFIRNFVSCFQRWNAPKYLLGTSYGTLRCSGLAEYLSATHDFSLHGLILLGSAMDYSTLISQRNHFLPDCLLIPTFAATAWYHGRLWPEVSLEEVVDYARRFAYDEYAPFMLQPTRISAYEQDSFYTRLGELIGLPADTVYRYSGRFDEELYTTEFMASERKLIGNLDTRYVGDLSSIKRTRFEDPSYQDMQGIRSAFNLYLQEHLQIRRPFESYKTYSHHSWDFSTYDSFALPDVLQRLRRTLLYNADMKVFSGSGYYDCRTPFAATEYCFDHLELPPKYRSNFQFEYYEAGHGFIFDHPSLKKLKADLVKFYTEITHFTQKH